MNVARRTCGYIGTQFWNQGRTQGNQGTRDASITKHPKGRPGRNLPVPFHFQEVEKCTTERLKAAISPMGPAVRVSLFVSGCTNHSEHCFQPETWAFDYGKPFYGRDPGRAAENAGAVLYQRPDPAGRRAV